MSSRVPRTRTPSMRRRRLRLSSSSSATGVKPLLGIAHHAAQQPPAGLARAEHDHARARASARRRAGCAAADQEAPREHPGQGQRARDGGTERGIDEVMEHRRPHRERSGGEHHHAPEVDRLVEGAKLVADAIRADDRCRSRRATAAATAATASVVEMKSTWLSKLYRNQYATKIETNQITASMTGRTQRR